MNCGSVELFMNYEDFDYYAWRLFRRFPPLLITYLFYVQ